MANDKDLEAALLDVANSKAPNYAAIARNRGVHPSTLSRRARGVTVSRAVATEHGNRLLIDAQEDTLLKDIEILSNKGIHITSRILRNTVERLVGHPIGVKWANRFQTRHKHRIKSIYLKGFDRERKIADNTTNIGHFYTNVSS
jgi:hypothetical protein